MNKWYINICDRKAHTAAHSQQQYSRWKCNRGKKKQNTVNANAWRMRARGVERSQRWYDGKTKLTKLTDGNKDKSCSSVFFLLLLYLRGVVVVVQCIVIIWSSLNLSDVFFSIVVFVFVLSCSSNVCDHSRYISHYVLLVSPTLSHLFRHTDQYVMTCDDGNGSKSYSKTVANAAHVCCVSNTNNPPNLKLSLRLLKLYQPEFFLLIRCPALAIFSAVHGTGYSNCFVLIYSSRCLNFNEIRDGMRRMKKKT